MDPPGASATASASKVEASAVKQEGLVNQGTPRSLEEEVDCSGLEEGKAPLKDGGKFTSKSNGQDAAIRHRHQEEREEEEETLQVEQRQATFEDPSQAKAADIGKQLAHTARAANAPHIGQGVLAMPTFKDQVRSVHVPGEVVSDKTKTGAKSAPGEGGVRREATLSSPLLVATETSLKSDDYSNDESNTNIEQDQLPQSKDQVRPAGGLQATEKLPADGGPAFKDQVQVVTPATRPEEEAVSGVVFADARLLGNATSGNANIDNGVIQARVPPPTPSEQGSSEEEQQSQREAVKQQGKSKRRKFALIAALLLFVGGAAIVGGVCGSGHCADSSTSTTNNSVDSTLPTTTANPTTAAPTTSPSSAPTINGIDAATIDFLNSISFATQPIRYVVKTDDATPEELAAQWLIREDPLQLSTVVPANRAQLTQRYAPLTIWYGMGGPSWRSRTGWLSDEDECTWFGVECTVNSTVTAIALASNNVNGQIPNDIALLPRLTSLMISDNPSLTGWLPSFVGNLEFLEVLDVASCGLAGTIPSDIGALTNLQDLLLNANSLTGSLPFTLGKCRSMEYFWIYENNFTNTLPNNLDQWESLFSFNIGDNDFNGTLNGDMIGQWLDLEGFLVYRNSFTGTLPSSVGNWSNLVVFDVDENFLTSTLPSKVGAFTECFYFDVNTNRFEGTLPQSIGQMTSLIEFFVGDNLFTGKIPDSISNWVNIADAHFDYNLFTGMYHT